MEELAQEAQLSVANTSQHLQRLKQARLVTAVSGLAHPAWRGTPDITTGVQHLSAQVNRDPYDGRFRIVAQAKGGDLNITFRWWASVIG